MSFRKDFQQFLFRGNVVDLAVGVVIGAAFGKIVSAFVADLVMPLVSALLPAGGWREWVWEPLPKMQFKIGDFLGVVIDFVIVALVIFLVLVKFVSLLKKKEAPAPAAAPATKTCAECTEAVPVAAKRCKFCTAVLTALVLLAMPFAAHAQGADPKFNYTKPEEAAPEKAEWKASAKGGMLQTSGNARNIGGNLSVTAGVKKGADRFTVDGGLAYVETSSRNFDPDGNKILDTKPAFVSNVTSNLWFGRGRYDRFLTLNNSLYVSGQALSDRPAGKEIVGGGQGGYSRQLYQDDMHLLVAEVGYDFAYEKAAAAGANGISIHSGRFFLSETLKLSDDTGLGVGIELLTNLNNVSEPVANYGTIDPLEDTRVNGKAQLTTKLWKNISFGFGFSYRFDNAPAPLKLPSDLTVYPGSVIKARRVDTVTEANLIITLL